MPDENHENALQISSRSDGAMVMEGVLSQRNAEDFQSALDSLSVEANGEMTFDLFGFDVEDGVAVATFINALRDLLKRVGRVKLIGAPQILCHNLYRVGLLESNSAIELVAMREDEPYA
jgi:anti-anti-sigma regulatory factor